nr:hypothetical protein [Tanacetum cinerariifolium]
MMGRVGPAGVSPTFGMLTVQRASGISKSKKHSLVVELEAQVERGDPAMHVEYMREIVTCVSELLGEFEKLLARAQVRVGLKDGYVTDMEEME